MTETARRRTLPIIAILAALALAGAAVSVWALTREPATGAAPAATTTVPTTTRAPAPQPSGERGADWHTINATQPWEDRVQSVDAIGRFLAIRTNLATTETSVALEICQAGHAYVASIGAADALVSVYALNTTQGTPLVTLASSRGGAPCTATL